MEKYNGIQHIFRYTLKGEHHEATAENASEYRGMVHSIVAQGGEIDVNSIEFKQEVTGDEKDLLDVQHLQRSYGKKTREVSPL